MMYTVWTFNDASCDDVQVFSGSLVDCLAFVNGDPDYYIQLPDGFTIYGA